MIGDPDLCRDRGMIRTRLPQCLIPLHSLPADQDILHRVIESMSHMQLSCNVRRRHNDRERLLIFIYFSMKISAVKPLLVETVFNSFWVISPRKFLFHNSSVPFYDVSLIAGIAKTPAFLYRVTVQASFAAASRPAPVRIKSASHPAAPRNRLKCRPVTVFRHMQ